MSRSRPRRAIASPSSRYRTTAAVSRRRPREHLQSFHAGRQRRPDESGLGHRTHGRPLLAELHGGKLDAHSPGPGQGSTFVFRLPAVQATPAEDAEQSRPGHSETRRVMVVDDNRDAADSAPAILRLLGHQVECAYTGAAALELARHFMPAIVLMDLAMPGRNGFETLRQMRAQPGTEHVFAVAMTGFGSGEDQRRTEAAGFDAHLTKPADLNALVALLDRATARSSQ